MFDVKYFREQAREYEYLIAQVRRTFQVFIYKAQTFLRYSARMHARVCECAHAQTNRIYNEAADAAPGCTDMYSWRNDYETVSQSVLSRYSQYTVRRL